MTNEGSRALGRRGFGSAALALALAPAGCKAEAAMKRRPIEPTGVSYAQAFEVSGFWTAVGAAVVVSLVNWALAALLRPEWRRRTQIVVRR